MRRAMEWGVGGMLLIGVLVSAGACPAAADPPHAPPEVRTLGSLSRHYGPVSFPHGAHVAMGGECATCHHEHPRRRTASCRGCHSFWFSLTRKRRKSAIRACSACHERVAPHRRDFPGLKGAYHQTCLTCHAVEAGSDPEGCTTLCHTRRGS